MSHESYTPYPSYESYSTIQTISPLHYDYSRPTYTPGGRQTRYVMVEINGKPTPVPCYGIEDYGFADNATNAPLPGETPEQTAARIKEDDHRMKRYTEQLKRKAHPYGTTSLPPLSTSSSLSHHYTSGSAHWQTSRSSSSLSASLSQPHLPYRIEAPQPRFPPPYSPHEVENTNSVPSTNHSHWGSGAPNDDAHSRTSQHPSLTIDTHISMPYSPDDQYSSRSSGSPSWQSTPSERPEYVGDHKSLPPDTPVESLTSPSIPTPSTPVDLLSLPPRSQDRLSSVSPTPKPERKSSKAAVYDQLLTFRPIGPKRKDPEAQSPIRHSAPSQIPSSDAVVDGPKPRQKATRIACRFCRGRKIACGQPPPGGDGHTCNQCLRRGLTCVYPEENHRGPGKNRRNNSGTPTSVSSAPQTFVEVFSSKEPMDSSCDAESNSPSNSM